MTMPKYTKAEVKVLYAELNNTYLKKVHEAADAAAKFADEHGLTFSINIGQYVPKSDYIVDEYEEDCVRENEGDEYGEKGWVTSFC